MGHEFEKSEHTSLETKRTTMKENSKNWRVRKHLRKRRAEKKYFLYNKKSQTDQKRGFLLLLKKSLSKMNLCQEYFCDFCFLCTK